MPVLPTNPPASSLLDWIDDVPPNIKTELRNRYDELTQLEQQQVQMGTTIPQLYGSLSRFIANPSSISSETFQRMISTDEQLGSGIDFLNLSLISRFGDYKHKDPDIQKFVRRCLDQMHGSWHENLEEMFSAEWAGYSVTEQIWDYKHDFDGAPAFVPNKLVTYPPLTLVFAVNRHGEILPDGIYQYQRFHNTFYNGYMGINKQELDGFRPDLFASMGDLPYPVRIAADLTYLTVKIPKSKVIHLRSSVSGKFSNPYGKSVLRRAYKSWVMKDAFLNMWVVAADRKGTPLVIGYAAPNDTVLSRNEGDGRVDQNQNRADLAMARAFKNVHNSSFLVLPGRKDEIYSVDSIQVQGDMNIFKDGIDYFNRAMMQSLLISELAMGSGGGVGSYGLASEHTKNYNRIMDSKLKVYKQGILDQFISKIISYNFPKKQWEKHGFGEFMLEEVDIDSMEKLSNIYRTLTESGYLSPEQQADMDYVREKMGMKKGKAQTSFSDETELDPDFDLKTDPMNPNSMELPKGTPRDREDRLPPNYRV